MRTPLALLIVALLGGCAASTTPNYDARFGDAVRQARQRMTLNPTASANPDPIAGMDGRSARDAVVRYQDTFRAPPPVVNVINIGGSTSAGQ